MAHKPICFIIMGYGKKTDPETGKTLDLDKTYSNIIKPAVIAAGYECIRGDEIQESGIIDRGMYAMLIHADIVIADISTFNPNALYELGIRHASRPFSTIILKEDESKIPFDLNHNKIFHYTHMGSDIGATEADRCVKELTTLIQVVSKSGEVDSPLFQYLKSVIPNQLSEEDYTEMIKELSEKEKHIFALVEHAKTEMIKSNFEASAALWKKAHGKVENEPYFIQQWALARYKSKNPSERTALQDALQIINLLKPDDTNDPETLGITGAIYKNLWLLDKDAEYLNRSTKYYRKGFQINSDYYTGENYALCCDFNALEENNNEEKIYFTIEARKTREAIIDIISQIFSDGGFENRSDLKWLYATYSHCLLALGKEEDAELYEQLFYKNVEADWEKATFNKSKEHILKLK